MSSFDFKHGTTNAKSSGALEAIDVADPFGYMFPDLARDPQALLPVSDGTIDALTALSEALIENTDSPDRNSKIPPVYTYWGQFIDHDITATNSELNEDILDETFSPQDPDKVVAKVTNRRRAILDLDSVYGDGPNGEAAHFYDGPRLKVGITTDTGVGSVPNPHLGNNRDLPRDANGKAIIGDSRNDENTIIAQFHTAFLKFHNSVANRLESTGSQPENLFEHAREITRCTYQWLVVNDYLKTITLPGTVDKMLYCGKKYYDPPADNVFMPFEFSVAAFRFGHSMVRTDYDFNENFGLEAGLIPSAPFDFLFQFTGGGGLGGSPTLPNNWIIDWQRFIDKGSSHTDRFARKVDTRLAKFLAELVNDEKKLEEERTAMGMPISELQRKIVVHLARRNLLRGYLMSIPTGQMVADKMGVPKLRPDQILQDNPAGVNDALRAGGFETKTPLWYYILKEAEIQANGESLGEVGSRIVASTIIGLLQKDPLSYLNLKWNPSLGVAMENNEPITTIGDFLNFAGVLHQSPSQVPDKPEPVYA